MKSPQKALNYIASALFAGAVSCNCVTNSDNQPIPQSHEFVSYCNKSLRAGKIMPPLLKRNEWGIKRADLTEFYFGNAPFPSKSTGKVFSIMNREARARLYMEVDRKWSADTLWSAMTSAGGDRPVILNVEVIYPKISDESTNILRPVNK